MPGGSTASRLVAEAVDVLTTLPRAGAQRAIAAMLAAAPPHPRRPARAACRSRRASSRPATGRWAAVLLPLVLAGADDAGRADRAHHDHRRPPGEGAEGRAAPSAAGARPPGAGRGAGGARCARPAAADERRREAAHAGRGPRHAPRGTRPPAVERGQPATLGLWTLDPPGAPVVARQVTGPSVVDRQVAQGVALELRSGQDDMPPARRADPGGAVPGSPRRARPPQG